MSKWKMVKLGDVCELINGDRGKNYPSSKDFLNDGIPFINTGHLSNNRIDFTNMNYISEEKFNVLGSGKIQEGDILYCLRGSLGKHAIVTTNNGAIASSLVILRVKNDIINEKYLSYCIDTSIVSEQQAIANNGSSQPNLSASSVKQYKIPLPPLEVQKKIANILDKACELIEKRKTQIAKLDELTKSIFIDMFGDPMTNPKGWELKCMTDICIFNPRKSELIKVDDDFMVSFVRMENVSNDGKIDASTYKEYQEVKNGFTYFKEDDVLFAKITPCMENGKGAIAKGLCNGTGFGSTEFHVLRYKAGVTNSAWIYYLTMLPIFRINAEKNMTGSAGQKRVPKSFFDSFRIPLPPIELQNQFAAIVEKIEEQKALLSHGLKKMELNYKSLMQKLFN